MAYKVTVSPRAQREIENAIDYYALYSANAPLHFISALKEAYSLLESNPLFMVHYKNIRALKLKRFPYLLYFTVNDDTQLIKVLACFHSKRDPEKRP